MNKKITYCLSYPIVLTRACGMRCGYCRFPFVEPGRLPTIKAVRGHLREAARLGAIQIELIAGEGLATDPRIDESVRYYGFDSYQSYLTRILQLVEATNRKSHLFSLLNLGPLSLAELKAMRPYLCAMRLMLESADPILEFREAHCEAPDKLPSRRLEAILCCGKAGVPLTTGIMVGIGETRASRRLAFDILARAHERYGHIQAVRVQMFHPIPETPMAHYDPVDDETFLDTVADARRMMGPEMQIQVAVDEHPHLIGRLLEAGVNDFGEISVRRHPRMETGPLDLIRLIEAEVRARGMTLDVRFPLHAAYCSKQWYPGGFPHRIPAAVAIRRERARVL